MSSDLEEQLTATLRDRAGGEVDPAVLLRRAVGRGAGLRRRCRALLGAGGAALCALIATVALTVPGQRWGTDAAAVPPLPAAPGEAGAGVRPELVGSDPSVLHFTADDLVAGAERVSWSAGLGTETVSTGGVYFVLTRSAAVLDAHRSPLPGTGRPGPAARISVAGLPGTAWSDVISPELTLWKVRWQPAEGLWARLEIGASGPGEAVAAATRIRFDGARRCVVPFRLEALPADARQLSCRTQFGPDGFEEGSVVVGTPSRWLTVAVQRAPGSEPRGDLRAGPYRVGREDHRILTTYVEPLHVQALFRELGRTATGYTESDALTVLGGYRQARTLDDVDTW